MGGWIFGAGMDATRIFYGGSLSGNTVAPSTFDAASDNIPANQITPIFMTNGLSYSTIEKMTLSITGTKTTSLYYLFQDGSQGNTTTNKLSELGIGSGTFGILAGYQSNALCSECTYINVIFGGCGRGLHLDSFNALDHQVFGGGANSCTGAAYSCPAGQINTIQGVSLSGNAIDFFCLQATPRYRSSVGVLKGPLRAYALMCVLERCIWAGFYFKGLQVLPSWTPRRVLSSDACQYAPAAGSGVIVAVGSAGQAIIDGMVANSGVGGTITGSAGSKVYLRGCRPRSKQCHGYRQLYRDYVEPLMPDAATIAWVNQVVTNGGTVSAGRQTLVDNLIVGLKADGIWTKLERLWLFAAENTISALTDLVGLTLATANNSPTFTADVGYTGVDAGTDVHT